MVICVAALIVFSFLSIFSAKYRPWAKEAFKCVFRMVTLKPCEAGFHRKVKMKLVLKSAKVSTRLSRFVYKYFKILSWIFTITLIGSLIISVNGIYNLVTYGSCDPHSETCILNPDAGLSCGSEHCETEGCSCDDIECNETNNYAACEGDCDCIETICG